MTDAIPDEVVEAVAWAICDGRVYKGRFDYLGGGWRGRQKPWLEAGRNSILAYRRAMRERGGGGDNNDSKR